MIEILSQYLSAEEIKALRVFWQVLAWTITIFATSGLVIYWGFRHTWAMLNVMWDHYVRKLNPQLVINKGIVSVWGQVYNDQSAVDFLKDRVRSLQKQNIRKFEQKILQDIIDDMGEIKIKFKGKNKNKLRGKGYQVKNGVKKRIRV